MKKERIVLFGAGGIAKEFYKANNNRNNMEIVAFADNFKTGELFGLPILKPEDLVNLNFDTIFIATLAVESITKRLLELGLSSSKIRNLVDRYLSRNVFLKRFAQEVRRKNLAGDVAEAGVFQGDFAAVINEYFPEKKLFLFDTFTGFDDRDIKLENGYETDLSRGEHFKNTSVELVLSKMKYPENCIIRQGHVPESLSGVNCQFCFVNLDMDLFQPTLVALEWFWPKMVHHGVILVHDYFEDTGTYPNLKKAVMQFTAKNNISDLPIGDDLSIALIKN